MSKALAPFALEYNPQFAQLLHDLNISLAISTYQAHKVIILSAINGDKLIQLPRTFPTAMGMAIKDNKLAVATEDTVEIMINSTCLANNYPQKPNVYDFMYLPRITFHTGRLALHDMVFEPDGKLIAVNTLFSCLVYIDSNHSFIPIWQPPFIDELAAEDRCHLNGIAIDNGKIKYLSALGKSNTPEGWRNDKMDGGIILEYPSGEIILDGLGMPHSPRVYNGKLYVLNSTKGELIRIDPETRSYDVICNVDGFARGMDMIGDYLFIGVSKLRHNSRVFNDLPIAKTSFAGIVIVYLPYENVVGRVEYKMSVDEIYDVKIIPSLRPTIISPDMEIRKYAIAAQDKCIWTIPSNS